MANVDAAFGFVPLRHMSGYAPRANEYTIASGLAENIFTGATSNPSNRTSSSNALVELLDSNTGSYSEGYWSYSKPKRVFNPGSSIFANCALFIAIVVLPYIPALSLSRCSLISTSITALVPKALLGDL